MKNLLFVASILGCAAIIIVSHLYYNQKLESIAENSDLKVVQTEPSSDKDTTSETTSTEEDQAEVAITGPLKRWIDKKSVDEPILITAFGSDSLSHGVSSEQAWPNLVNQELVALFPTNEFQTTTINVGRISSQAVSEGDYISRVIDSNPDILLFEPFILNDNGVLPINDTFYFLDPMVTQLEEALPDTTFIFMPPNPIYNAGHYLEQLRALEEYVDQKGYLYANHWEAWPTTDDPAIDDYVDNARTNEQGHILWSEYMVDYLIY